MFWGGGRGSGSDVSMQGGRKAPETLPKAAEYQKSAVQPGLLAGGGIELMCDGFFQACHVDASEGVRR